jgi:hypothetical protein
MGHENHEREDDMAGSSNRSFGFTLAIALGLIGLWPVATGSGVRTWALMVSASFAVCAGVFPAVLAPLNRAWFLVGRLMHMLVNPVVLGIMFFLVVTPIGLAMRAFGKDPLRRRFDKELSTYWIERTPPGPAPESLKDQF